VARPTLWDTTHVGFESAFDPLLTLVCFAVPLLRGDHSATCPRVRALAAVVVALLVVPLWDWAAITRVGAYAFDCDYRYWPPSRARAASVVLVGIAVAVAGAFARPDPNHPPIWALAMLGGAFVIWGVIGFLDVVAQNRKGDRAPPPPPRYSDPRS